MRQAAAFRSYLRKSFLIECDTAPHCKKVFLFYDSVPMTPFLSLWFSSYPTFQLRNPFLDGATSARTPRLS